MAFYISNKQILPTQSISPEYIPTLLEAKHGLKHRVFSRLINSVSY